MKKSFEYLTLFSSTGTLLCCALPALLVSIGAGGAMAFIYANIPGYTWIGENKDLVFASVALLLIFNGIILWLKRNEPCPIDKDKARACQQARRFSYLVYAVSIIIFGIGLFFSYFAIYFIN